MKEQIKYLAESWGKFCSVHDCHCTMGGQPSIKAVNSSQCIGKNIMALEKRGT